MLLEASNAIDVQAHSTIVVRPRECHVMPGSVNHRSAPLDDAFHSMSKARFPSRMKKAISPGDHRSPGSMIDMIVPSPRVEIHAAKV